MQIILPLDGSKESFAAAQMLASLPFAEKPHVTVVTATVEVATHIMTSEADTWVRNAEQSNALNAFKQAQELLGDRCASLEHVVEQAHPSRLILKIAEARSADLVVLGARGHSAAYRVVLGSTADYVVNHAKCAVLVARPKPDAPEIGIPRRLLLAYDGSAQAQQARQQLCSLNWPQDTEIHVTMVLERPKLLPNEDVYDEESISNSQSDLDGISGLDALGCQIKRSVRECVHIGSGIQSLTEKEDTDLLFIGGTGKSALASFFLGSVSRYVLHHTHCSLWVAREKLWGN